MQSRDSHEKNIAGTTSSAYPQSDHEVPPIPPPQYSASSYPYQQPSRATYPYPQPGGVYPTAPVLHEPTSTVHNTDTTILIHQWEREWSTEFYDCFQDPEICFLGGISYVSGVPLLQCMVGDYAEGNGCTGVYCGAAIRTKIRMKHNIQGSVCKDGLAVVCCNTCAMCQMQREMKMHGI